MTAQYPEVLNADDDFEGLYLYRLIRGTPDSPERFAFQSPPTPPTNIVCSALGRGYIAEFVLDAEGVLTVVAFRYRRPVEYTIGEDGFARSHGDEWEAVTVNEQIDGDFWLDFRREYFAPSTFVPFRYGKIVRDQSQWITPK